LAYHTKKSYNIASNNLKKILKVVSINYIKYLTKKKLYITLQSISNIKFHINSYKEMTPFSIQNLKTLGL